MSISDEVKSTMNSISSVIPDNMTVKFQSNKMLRLLSVDGEIQDINNNYFEGISLFNSNFYNKPNIFFSSNNYDITYISNFLLKYAKLNNNKSSLKCTSHPVQYSNTIDNNYIYNIINYINYINYILKTLPNIQTTKVVFRELIEERFIFNKLRESILVTIIKPEIRVKAYFNNYNYNEYINIGSGISGSLNELKSSFELEKYLYDNLPLLSLPLNLHFVKGYYTTLISPEVVGFICHEAIGHLSESDSVLNNNCFYNKLNECISNEAVNIVDCGNSGILNGAGDIFFDDEGTKCDTTYIIKNGHINSFLHNNYTSNILKNAPTGNFRSSAFNFPPSIRMTNTYMLNGEHSFDELISSISYGIYLKDGIIEGSSSDNGIFRITIRNSYIIKNGKLVSKIKNLTLYDNVFNFFKNIIAVGNDMKLCLGTSRCGKNQSIKVDGGGPHIIAKAYLE
jgi:TldD protein